MHWRHRCGHKNRKSQKEVEAINAISAAKTPDEQIKAIENVLTNFADTEFKQVLLQMAMQIETAERRLRTNHVLWSAAAGGRSQKRVALVTLAGETARHTREFDLDKEEKLAKVDKWAKDGIEAAKVMPKTRADITDEQWEQRAQRFSSARLRSAGDVRGTA